MEHQPHIRLGSKVSSERQHFCSKKRRRYSSFVHPGIHTIIIMPSDVHSLQHSPGQTTTTTTTTTPPSTMAQQDQSQPHHSNSSRRSSRSLQPSTPFHTYNFPPPGQSIQGFGSTLDNNTGVGNGPGPLRHPRPLTAAELHWQLEKEQEAVVSVFLPVRIRIEFKL